MPALAAIPWLVPLLTIGTAAGTLATTGYELAQGSGGGQQAEQAEIQQQQQQQQAQQQAQQKAALLAAIPNAQSQTSGSLAGSALTSQAATNAGVPSNLTSLAQLLGQGGNISGGTTTPGQQQQPSLQQLSDLLAA
jgi:hypothetical protein